MREGKKRQRGSKGGRRKVVPVLHGKPVVLVKCLEFGHKPESRACLRTQANGGKKVCARCELTT